MLKTQDSRIREATQEDIFDILVLAREFSREAPKSHKWDKDKTEQFVLSAIQNTNMGVFVIDVDGEIQGALIGLLSEFYMSHKTIASELAWFVSKDFRGTVSSIKLVKHFEKWAKSNGANYIGMCDIEGIINLSSLYTRMGYSKAESVYLKEI